MKSTKPMTPVKTETTRTLRLVLLSAIIGFVLPNLFLQGPGLFFIVPSFWWFITGASGEKGQAFPELISMSLFAGLPGASIGRTACHHC